MNLVRQEVKRVVGMVSKVAPDELGSMQAVEVKNYDAAPIGCLERRAGCINASLTDYAAAAINTSWFTSNWGDNDVDSLIVRPSSTRIKPPYTGGTAKPSSKVMMTGGSGKVHGPITAAATERRFLVSVPGTVVNGKAFNVTVTAQKPDGNGGWATDTAFTGAVTLRGWFATWRNIEAPDSFFTQNTAPAAVTFASGVATISATWTLLDPPLKGSGSITCYVFAYYGTDKRSGINGESNAHEVTSSSYLTVAVSAATVPTGTAFTLTVTAKNADGTTHTDYGTQVDVTDNNGSLSLVDATTGAAFTAFAAGDFSNGVASKSLKWSGSIGSDASVLITGTEHGALSPTGVVAQTVQPPASAAYWS